MNRRETRRRNSLSKQRPNRAGYFFRLFIAAAEPEFNWSKKSWNCCETEAFSQFEAEPLVLINKMRLNNSEENRSTHTEVERERERWGRQNL